MEADGLFGAPPITVIVGGEVHPSARKALGMAGFGRNRVVTVPVDDQGRMRADAFPEISGPTIVLMQAGNVNTGAFDPFSEIIPRAKEAGAWAHIDGAFGLWGAATPEYAHLLRGADGADSWATDAHKFLNTPYDCGLVFVRNPETMRAGLAVSAAYLPSVSHDPYDHTPEMSRRARGVEVWAAMRTLGRSGVAAMVAQACHSAHHFAESMRAAGYPPLHDVVFNQALFSFGDDATTRRIITAIQNDGTLWCGPTVWQGQTAMRVSVSNWATTEAEIDRSVEAVIRLAHANA